MLKILNRIWGLPPRNHFGKRSGFSVDRRPDHQFVPLIQLPARSRGGRPRPQGLACPRCIALDEMDQPLGEVDIFFQKFVRAHPGIHFQVRSVR